MKEQHIYKCRSMKKKNNADLVSWELTKPLWEKMLILYIFLMAAP